MGCLNKAIIIGNIGANPEISTMQSGKEVANISVATSSKWKDKEGQYQEKTEWHRVVIFSEPLIKLTKNYLKKGSKIYLEGQIETRNWEDNNGQKKYTTEIVLRPYRSQITMLDSKASSQGGYDNGESNNAQPTSHGCDAPLDDDIPF